MKEFFGIGGFTREPSGAFSFEHLLIVSIFIALMIGLAVGFGIWARKKEYKTKNRVVVIAAISILSFEALKIIINCIDSDNIVKTLLWNLPLFLCSIQLIAIPVAAFCKGRLKEGALDFVVIFGILGALVGPLGAAQDYSAYPAVSFHNLVSATTHSISGFTSLFIMISGMVSMKRKNIWITHAILGVFAVLAYTVNALTGLAYGDSIYDGCNYMFLMADDGTPYTIVTAMTGGNKVLYPIAVILLLVVYMAVFYGIFYLVQHLRSKNTKSIEA